MGEVKHRWFGLREPSEGKGRTIRGYARALNNTNSFMAEL